MNLAFLLAIYFIIWWIALFVVLPFGVRTQEEAGAVVPGTPPGAPAAFRIVRVLVATTLLAGAIFAVLWAAVTWRIIDLQGLMEVATP